MTLLRSANINYKTDVKISDVNVKQPDANINVKQPDANVGGVKTGGNVGGVKTGGNVGGEFNPEGIKTETGGTTGSKTGLNASTTQNASAGSSLFGNTSTKTDTGTNVNAGKTGTDLNNFNPDSSKIDAETKQTLDKFDPDNTKINPSPEDIELANKIVRQEMGIGKTDKISPEMAKEFDTKIKRKLDEFFENPGARSRAEADLKTFLDKNPKFKNFLDKYGAKLGLASLGGIALLTYMLITGKSAGEAMADVVSKGTEAVLNTALKTLEAAAKGASKVAPELANLAKGVSKPFIDTIKDFFKNLSTTAFLFIGGIIGIFVLKSLLLDKQSGGGLNISKNVQLIIMLIALYIMLILYTNKNIELFKPRTSLIEFLYTDYLKFIQKPSKNKPLIETKNLNDFLKRFYENLEDSDGDENQNTYLAYFLIKIVNDEKINNLLRDYQMKYKDTRSLTEIRYELMTELLLNLRNSKELRSHHMYYFN